MLKMRKSIVRTLVLLNPSESQNLFSPSSESQACEFSPLLEGCGVGISARLIKADPRTANDV